MERKQIAGFVIEGTLGEGGMGIVYRGRDVTLDRQLAIKVIHPSKLGDHGKERFLREARACSKIIHPNIITVYAAGEDNGHPYLAMELIDGKTLRDIVSKGPVEWKTATRYMIDLLDAVSHLHDEGIVHRDLKPDNIMVTKDGVIKLMDFGLAHLQSSTTLTEEGTTLGTVPYMSPEQVMGNKADARSDLFSLASVFHEMITGLHPFRGEHPMAVMYSIRNETPRALKLSSQELPVGMQAVLDKAFTKEVDKRYQSAAEFRDALAALLPDSASSASDAGAGAGGAGRKILLPVVVVAAAVVLVAVVFGWNLLRNGAPPPDRDKARNLNELGQNRMDAGDLLAAETHFRESIDADGTYPIPWNNLGMMALARNDLDDADADFREAVERDPSYAEGYHNRGWVAELRDDTNGAMSLYARAIEADSSFAPSYNNLGVLQRQAGDLDAARATLMTGLRLGAQREFRKYLLKNRGLVAWSLNNADSARYYLYQIRDSFPDDEELHRALDALSQ
jgi:Tfp pilus assembly protein PilF/predicted Ser/Thr protein kinase